MSHAQPIDVLTERAFLACVLVSQDPREVMDLACELYPQDFADSACGATFRAMQSLDGKGHGIDEVTLRAEMGERCDQDLIDSLHTARAAVSNAPTYVERIRELSQRRSMLTAARGIVSQATDPSVSTPAFLDAAETAVLTAAEQRRQGDRVSTMRELAVGVRERIDNPSVIPPGIPCGVSTLDQRLNGGARPGQVIVIAARPGNGKTALATGWAASGGKRGVSTLVFSLEMERAELAQRIIASESRVDLADLIAGKLSESDREAVARTSDRVAAWPVVVDDTPAITLAAVRSRCRRVMREHGGLGLVVIDYLQLMGRPNTGNRNEREDQQIGAITRGLKALAKEMGVAIVLLSQLNRKSEDRADKRPQLSDLRASGEIEQDADVVILLHRPIDNNGNPRDGVAEMNVAKQRNGSTGLFDVAWLAHCATFASLDRGSR